MVDVKINLQTLAAAAINAITPGSSIPEIKAGESLKPLTAQQLLVLIAKPAVGNSIIK